MPAEEEEAEDDEDDEVDEDDDAESWSSIGISDRLGVNTEGSCTEGLSAEDDDSLTGPFHAVAEG